jgi:hypothetical protein
MALTSTQKSRLETLKNLEKAYDTSRGPRWQEQIKKVRDEIKELMAIKKQKPKLKTVKREPEPEPVEVEDESQAAKGPPKQIRKQSGKKDQSGKKLIELAKRDELKQKQKRAKLYKEREANRQAKIRKAANKRVNKISSANTSQLVAPSKRKEGPAARYIREQKEAENEAKDRRAGETKHFKKLQKDKVRRAKGEPKEVQGPSEYVDDPDYMGPGLRKYKLDLPFFGGVEFDLDTRDFAKPSVTSEYKAGGQVKKGVKKTKAKARKRAALRGHRAELRGG